MHLPGMDRIYRFRVTGYDICRRIYLHKPAALYQGDTVAKRGLVHIRSRYQNRQPLFFQLYQHLPKLFAGYRIDPRRRLVEKKDRRLMYKRATQCQFLLHSSGEFPGFPVFKRFYLPVYIGYQVIIFFDGRMKNRSEKSEIFFHRQILIQGKTPGHISYAIAYLPIVFHDIEPCYGRCSRIGQNKRCQNSEKRRFPRAIRSYDSVNLPGIHIKRYIAQCPHIPIRFAYMMCRNTIHRLVFNNIFHL